MSQIQRDIVAKFGVLYAGGVIAYEMDISPLSIKHVSKAVRRACRSALAQLPDPEAEVRSDLRRLTECLAGGSILDLENCSKKQQNMMRSADGYHKPRERGHEYTVRAQVFTNWFRSPVRTRRVLEWLAEEGFLDCRGTVASGRSNEWAQKQVIWPDGTRQRSIILYLPAGLDDLVR